jgi:hypothetical protein
VAWFVVRKRGYRFPRAIYQQYGYALHLWAYAWGKALQADADVSTASSVYSALSVENATLVAGPCPRCTFRASLLCAVAVRGRMTRNRTWPTLVVVEYEFFPLCAAPSKCQITAAMAPRTRIQHVHL